MKMDNIRFPFMKNLSQTAQIRKGQRLSGNIHAYSGFIDPNPIDLFFFIMFILTKTNYPYIKIGCPFRQILTSTFNTSDMGIIIIRNM